MSRTLRVLSVEDSEQDLALLRRHLSHAGYSLFSERVDTAPAMRAALERQEWDVILCDYSMPQFNAIAALAVLRETQRDIPFIVISGTIGESIAVETMRAGAHDYLMKDNLARLAPAIERELAEAANRHARRRAEEALRESEDRYRNLVEQSHDLICTHDLGGRVLSINRTAASLLGYDQDALLNRNIRELLAPEFRDRFDDYISTLESQGVAQGTMAIQTITGETRLWKYDNSLRTKGVAEPIVRGLAHDVTEQSQAEKSRRETQARLAGIVDSAMDAIVSTDSEQKIILFNTAAEKIFGWPASDAIGRPLGILIPERFREEHRRHIERFGASGVTARSVRPSSVLTGVRASGEEFPIEASISQVTVAGAKLFTVILRDVTERKHLEDQLRQSQKMEAVGRLAGGVAHDFNNLLTAIIGYSQLTKSHLDPASPMFREIEEIEKAGQRAAALTSQLLAFSRKQMLQPKVIDLNEIVTDIERMLKRLIGEDIEVSTSTSDDLGRVLADPGQLQQILMNLAVNARDAMPTGGKLTIETSNVDLDEHYAQSHADVDPGRYVLLAVSDTGCGMDAETQSHIFEPFFTTKQHGTGLGLPTVYGIVKQSGGHIWVYSEPGHGSAFKIYFPALTEEAEPAELEPERSGSLEGSETILLVEDDRAVRRFCRAALEMNGYVVLEAERGAQALEAFGPLANAIDLVITDVIMPEMGGSELVVHLQRLQPEIRVLYVSGYTEEATILHGILKSGVHFLPKPFTPIALSRKVRSILDERSGS